MAERFGPMTPWGRADGWQELDRGVVQCSTPGHGGLFVPDSLLGAIPPERRAWAAHWSGSENWYEEDCCWAAVALAFPELFSPELRDLAARIVADYCPAA